MNIVRNNKLKTNDINALLRQYLLGKYKSIRPCEDIDFTESDKRRCHEA